MTSTTAHVTPTPVEVKFSAHAGRGTRLLSLPGLDRADAAQRFSIQSHPLHGCLSLQPDGRLIYVAESGYVGPDRFSYSLADTDRQADVPYLVHVEVTPSGLVASAARWAYFALRNDTLLEFPEAALLRAKPGDSIEDLSLGGVEQPLHGTLCRREDGSYTYVPKPGYVGPDAFDYLIIGARCHRAQVMVKLDIFAPAVAPTIELVPPQQSDVCERLLNNAPTGALLPTLQGMTVPGSRVTVVLDGRAVARVPVNGQGRWVYSSERLALDGATHLQAYVQMPDGCVAATPRLSGKAAMVEAFGSSCSGYWATSTSSGHSTGYHGKSALAAGGYFAGWGDRSWAGPGGWTPR